MRQRLSYLGFGHVQVIYETLSLVDSCPVEIIEVRSGQGFIIGWAHLHHLSGTQPRMSILKELFVWPTLHRYGYGTMLEQLACERARAWTSQHIQLWLYAEDDLRRVHSPGRKFGTTLGYRWKRVRQSRPHLSAIGEKAL